ncbi:MAG: hypothetical protein IPP94_14950 [Ignavibacteria bacterium]|nr:hypothetical protein [Ignavibacteria bacterium]
MKGLDAACRLNGQILLFAQNDGRAQISLHDVFALYEAQHGEASMNDRFRNAFGAVFFAANATAKCPMNMRKNWVVKGVVHRESSISSP